MPDEGVTGWDDAVRGRIEFPNDAARGRRDRPLGRPPDVQLRLAGRGHGRRDHARDPRRRPHLEHAEADPDPARARPRAARLRARRAASSAPTARSSRSATAPSRSTSSASAGYLPEALVNFLALIGWAPDGETTIMSRDEIVERFTPRGGEPEPRDVRLRQARLDERRLHPRPRAARRSPTGRRASSASRGSTGRRSGCARWRRSCRRRSGGSARSRASSGSSSVTSSPIRRCSTRASSAPRTLRSRTLEPWTAETIEAALKALCEELGEKPRTVFAPIRVAVTGSRVSPGLYESLELLGRDVALERLRRGAEVAA